MNGLFFCVLEEHFSEFVIQLGDRNYRMKVGEFKGTTHLIAALVRVDQLSRIYVSLLRALGVLDHNADVLTAFVPPTASGKN